MAILRTLMTMPILVAPVVAAVMWRFMYQPDFGIINHALTSIGLPAVGWLSNPSIALFSIAVIDVWQWTPFVFLDSPRRDVWHPGDTYYEAAELDGTNLWRQTIFITIPLLKRVLVIVLLLRLIDLLRAFEIIVATTQGGPGDASYTLAGADLGDGVCELRDRRRRCGVRRFAYPRHRARSRLLVRAISRRSVVGR